MERGRRALLLAVVLVSGAAVLVLEMAAGRLFAPWFGMSLPVWTNVLAVVLGALAAGYALGGRLAARGATLAVPGWVLIAAGLLSVAAAFAGPALARSLLPAEADLEGLAAVLVRGSLVATLLVFGPPMALLGTVGPLAVHLLAEGGRLNPSVMAGPASSTGSGQAAGRVLALSTMGSIAGTFLATYLLIPGLGTRLAVASAGGALALCGVLLVAASSGRGRAAAAAAGAAILGLAAASPSGEFRPAVEGTGRVLAEYDSSYQFLQVREVEDAGNAASPVPTRLLTMNEGVATYHSVMKPGSVLTGGRYYDLYPPLPLLAGGDPGAPLDVLVLGFAAGTQARALRHFHGQGREVRVDGVEIDPAVLEAGRAFFGLPPDGAGLRTFPLDARAFLRGAPADLRYDLILVDCYSQEYYIPWHVATAEFFASARARLKPGGILAYNAFAYRPDDELLGALVNTTAKVFGRAWRLEVPGYPNYVVLASAREGDLPLLGLSERIARARTDPSSAPPALRAFASRPEAAPVLALFARAAGAAWPHAFDPALPVLTDDRAPVERMTDRGIARYDRSRRAAR